jgi:hypothetical protein
MSTQDQYLRQDVVAQQNFEVLGNTTGGGGNYSGATTDSLAIDDVTGLDTYQYRCVVTSDSTIAPTATSAAATLTVT